MVAIGVFAYFCESIPTGFWLGKAIRRIDIREHGSGSTGATNVLRTLGAGPALTTLSVDIAKGFVAVSATHWLASQPEIVSLSANALNSDQTIYWIMSMTAMLALLGHARSPWIGFSGGKSAATGLGILIAMSWTVALFVVTFFALTLAITRIVSLSSILAAVAAIVGMLVFDQPFAFVVMANAGAAYVIVRHRANIFRLMAGTEPRVAFQTDKDASETLN
jgi:acyl phosphate:glycerol-3-phosphate acyltransferase